MELEYIDKLEKIKSRYIKDGVKSSEYVHMISDLLELISDLEHKIEVLEDREIYFYLFQQGE